MNQKQFFKKYHERVKQILCYAKPAEVDNFIFLLLQDIWFEFDEDEEEERESDCAWMDID